MNVIRGLSLCLLVTALGGCSTFFGNLWPTVPKGLNAVRQTSGHDKACNMFELRYGGDEAATTRFVSTLVSGKWQPPVPEVVSPELHQALFNNEEEPGYLGLERIRGHFDGFLDCYFVDLSTHKETRSKGEHEQLYALRGHAITTVLARYAAYNLTGRVGGGLHTTAFPPYEDAAGDASNVLTRIEHAQRLIRRDAPEELRFPDEEKPQVQKTDESLEHFPSVRRVNRIFSVVQLAFEAERPTLRRAQGFLTSVTGLITGQSITDFKNVVTYAVAGLEKAALLGPFSRAYQFDADAVFETISGAPTKGDWEKVDSALRDACDHLATIAGGAVPHCLPAAAAKETP